MQDLRSRSKQLNRKQWQGFTIVELLIVVVVIAILAAITIVAYNGITASAKESALKSDLTTAAKKLHVAKIEDGSFPGAKPGFMSANLAYAGGGNTFCVSGTANGKDFRIKESGSIEEGDCAAPVATTMQSFSSAQCSALPTFTGSNNEAVIQLTDSRGGTTRTYEVAKLADGKCWMINNLKLGSTSGAITLTPADSNVASNFTLPQLNNGSRAIIWSGTGNDYDTPYAYGPVDNDPGNYGYLYNFAAATAGETRTTFTSGNAQHSICPTNWRLPTGDSPSSNFGQLDVAFGGTGAYASGGPSVAKWQPSGPFKGSFSGHWYGGFIAQGVAGDLWSASALPDFPDAAFNAGFGPSYVAPGGGGDNRDYGFGVRCLLN